MSKDSHGKPQGRRESLLLLNARAVLTRLVCQELLASNGDFENGRCLVALNLLLKWIQENFPESIVFEPRAGDGLDQMFVPDDSVGLFEEIKAGVQVCDALWMLTFSDTPSETTSDKLRISGCLSEYWSKHAEVAHAPPFHPW